MEIWDERNYRYQNTDRHPDVPFDESKMWDTERTGRIASTVVMTVLIIAIATLLMLGVHHAS